MKLMLTMLISILSFNITQAEVVWNPLPKEAYTFGNAYPEAQSLLFAFDYGHALVYEKLLLSRGKITDPEAFEKELLSDVLKILKNPPVIKVDEGDIAPNYVYTFPLTINLFDWSHMLHQFVLDVLATSEDRGEGMQNRINEIYNQYKANKPIAITDVCKSMAFMDDHYFSKSFRQKFPSFNLLIWSYHWFQIKLYEALMAPTKAERDFNVKKTISDFWTLISDLPDSADFDMMPETAKEAPTFAKMFPKIPGAFDNNHMLHDIVSDILTSEKVPTSKIKSEGIRFGQMDLDPEAFKATSC
ncbi:MAG: hypothetical protein K2Q18_12860, partial [Bdellovibrionales bacterium]|nr:hypothetical protein [Bdellovibrionales bacterium]